MKEPIPPDLREALTLLARGDTANALPVLERWAHEGRPEACYTLGMLYAHGEGVTLDYSRAADLIGVAAEGGVADARRIQGWLYANGYGVGQDNDKARQCYLQAAESGDAAAQCEMGLMYQFGWLGAGQDSAEMLRWYRRSAEQGYARACFALGKLMAAGELLRRDDEAAFRWLTLAIMNGSEPAKKELAMLTARIPQAEIDRYKQRMLEEMGGTGTG